MSAVPVFGVQVSKRRRRRQPEPPTQASAMEQLSAAKLCHSTEYSSTILVESTQRLAAGQLPIMSRATHWKSPIWGEQHSVSAHAGVHSPVQSPSHSMPTSG